VAGYAALPIGRMAPRKNPSLDFPEDRRFAKQISGLLTRPPWLNIPWQETNPFPELVEGNNSQKTPVEKKVVLRYIAKR
jgi:hypothetical protein